VDPFRADAGHEFHFLRERPGLFEQKIDIPFCGMAAENRRYSCLKFKPLLDGRDFDSHCGRDIRSALDGVDLRTVGELPGPQPSIVTTQIYATSRQVTCVREPINWSKKCIRN